MRRRILTLPVLLFTALAAYAQSPRIFSISTGPGEDSSSQIGISWATDTTLTGTYVLLSRKGEHESVKVLPQQQERCTAFKGIWSDMPDGREFHEDAVFIKCGTMLEGLQPDTEYQYVIGADTGEQSGLHFFKTAGAREWSCCIISDFHSYTPLPGRLEASMGMIGKVKEYDPSVSWIFSPGDVVAWGGSYSFWKRLFEERAFSDMMWARANGNHDNWTKESQVTHDFDLPNDFFLGTSYYPRNGYEPEMGVCYHFRYGNTLFVMLNSEDMDKEGELEAAADWVRSVVTTARESLDPPTFVVVCEHVEWFLGTDGRDSFHKRWADVFDELGVDLALAGNNHVYLRSYPLRGDVRDDENGTIYMMTPASDNDRGREISSEVFANADKIARRWTEGPHSVGAVHMSATETSLTLTLLDRYGHRIDSCVINAAKNYNNLEPLTLLNRSVLDRSRRAIRRDDISTRAAVARLVSEADQLMQHPVLSPTVSDSQLLKTVCSEVRTLGEAYYLTGQEKYAARVYDYIRPWLADQATCISPRMPANSDFVAMSHIIDMLDGYLLTDDSKSWNSADDAAMRQWFDELLQWLQSEEMVAGMKDLDDYQGLGYDMLRTASKTFFEREWLHEMKVFVDSTTKARLDRILASDGKMMIGSGNTVLTETEHLVTLVRMALMAEKAGSNLWLYKTCNGGGIRQSIEWLSNLLLSDNSWVNSKDAKSIARNYTYILLSSACPLTSKKLYEERLDTLASMMDGKEDISTLSYQLTSPVVYGTLLSDEDFFNVINLDTPGLETVKADVAAGDIAKAKSGFVSYLRNREYRFDWYNADNSRDNGSYDIQEVTNTANNLLMGEQFGDTVIWTLNNQPLEYEEWPWGLSRHQYWIGLGRAYNATGDEQYARAFVGQLNSWIDQSPLPDYDAKIDYSRWRTIETGIRTLGSWPMAYLYFLQSPSFDDESVFLMLKSFYEHAIHLRKHHRTNNWLSMEMNGLMHIALMFPEFKEAAHWAEYAGTKIYQETEVQVYPDGAQVELTPGYHGTTLSNFLGLYSIARATGYEGLPKNFSNKLENMYDYYVKIVAPSGEVPAVNDSGWNDARASLAKGFGMFPERSDFRYIATCGKEGTMPSFTSTWMPWAGWYMMRSGWGQDDMYSHFEVGPYSPAHQHEDKLSLILYAYGKRLLTEGGTYSYDTSDWRKYVLSARAHNVSKVDGKYQNRHDYEPEADLGYSHEPMPNRWVSNDDCDFGEGWYDEGFGDEAGLADRNVEQYRALTFIKDRYWILFDIFTPKDGAQHQYDSYFHFNTDKYAVSGNFVVSDDEGANLAIIPLRGDAKVDVICGQTEPELQGWAPLPGKDGYDYNPVATPNFSYIEAGQSVSAYILYPLKPGEKNPVKSVRTKGKIIELRFANGDKDRITFSVEGKQLKTLSFKSKTKQFPILK